MCVSRVLRMFLHVTVACGTELPDVLGIKIRVAMLVRESTYLRSSHGSRRRSATKIRKILYLGFRRIYT
jgi:hypothetical protein